MSRPAQSKTNIIVAAIVAVFAVSGGVFALTRPDEKPQQATQQVAPAQDTQDHYETATVQPEYVSYKGVDGTSALDLLKKSADVQTKTSDFGEFVVSVNGNDGGGTKYWLYYVDGKESAVGAGAYMTKNGETIEWKLQ